MPDQKPMMVKCPQCGKPAHFTPENPHRPFCSERCQTIDLGAWAVERYKIPVNEIDPSTVNEKPGDEGFSDSIPAKHTLN